MRIVFDTSVLGIALNEDIATKTPEDDVNRVKYRMKTLSEENGALIIPTPVLAEIFIRHDKRFSDFIQSLQKSKFLEIADFNLKTAIELAAMERTLLENNTGKRVGKDEHKRAYQAIKVDKQIIAITKVTQVDSLYSADKDFVKIAKSLGINAYLLSEMELPPRPPQEELF